MRTHMTRSIENDNPSVLKAKVSFFLQMLDIPAVGKKNSRCIREIETGYLLDCDQCLKRFRIMALGHTETQRQMLGLPYGFFPLNYISFRQQECILLLYYSIRNKQPCEVLGHVLFTQF